ncbi:MAG: type III pantothenate kinase [Halobacteriovoraceae bacterium]|nr:type III pantothenate kinase [Halobacteriovoraceae bacterium]MCB9095650.1 type III pantothenate kinase [Halobacteriovoraceae bacterium]
MNFLTLDIGNSNNYCQIYRNKSREVIALESIQNHIEKNQSIYFSSVKNTEIFFNQHPYLKSFNLIDIKTFFEKDLFLDMPVAYSQSLGSDRLALAYYAYKKREPDQMAVTIDAGTFLTIDFISSNGYLGGFIFPGLQTFLNSYNQADQLLVLNSSEIKEQLFLDQLPQNTHKSIALAARHYIEAVVETVVKKYAKNQNLQFYLTGGDGQWLLQFLDKKSIRECSIGLVNAGLELIALQHISQLSSQEIQ